MARCDHRQIRAHSERTWCSIFTPVWSVDTLVWEVVIRGYFFLAQSDQRSLPDGTLTWAVIIRYKNNRCLLSASKAVYFLLEGHPNR